MIKRNVYKGRRYVPKIMGAWDSIRKPPYESLSVVIWGGISYTSKRDVPQGISIHDEYYWVITGNYNAQVEIYRRELKNKVDKKDIVDNLISGGSSKVLSAEQGVILNTKLKELVVNVKDFGAVGDGVTDDTKCIQHAIDYASKNNGSVFIPSGNYSVSQITVKNGVGKMIGDGVLVGNSTDPSNIIVNAGVLSNPLKNCYISLKINMENGDGTAIKGEACDGCVFEKNYIYNMTDNVLASRFGLYLGKGAKNNKILDNTIIGYENRSNPGLAIILIAIFGEGDEWGGFFNNGNIIPPTNPCTNNIVSGNHLVYGEVAVDLLSSEYSTVTNNICIKQKTRAIYVASATNNCTFKNNQLIGFGSSAFVIGFGSNNNIISDNVCKQIQGYNKTGNEATININTGAYDNLVSNNLIDSFCNFGIYMGVNMIGNVVQGNKIKGYYVSAISLENEWEKELGSEYMFARSRYNYAPPFVGDKWATKNSQKNIIQNNIIDTAYPGRQVASICMYQIGATKLTDNIIQNNSIIHPQQPNSFPINIHGNLELFSANYLVNNRVRDVSVNRISITNGKQYFKECYGNDGIDFGGVFFPSAVTEPDVGKGGYFKCGYSTPITITDFKGGIEGQIIKIKLNRNTIIKYGSSKIIPKNNVDILASSSPNEWVEFILSGNIWYEISRSF